MDLISTVNIITPQYYPKISGLSIVAQKNVLVLLDLGYKVNVLTSAGCKSFSKEKVYTFTIKGNSTVFRPVRGNKGLFIQTLKNLSENATCNIFHGWHSWSTNLGLSISGKLGTKNILYSHGTGFSTLDPIILRLLRRLNYIGARKQIDNYLKLIDGLIFVGNNIVHPRCYDLRHYKGDNKIYIPNPIPERNIEKDCSHQIIPDEMFFNNSYKLALCVSNYEKIKNQEYLIHLAKKMNFNLVLVGSEETQYSNYLQRELEKAKLSNQVKLLIGIGDCCIIELLKKSNMFLFASRQDFSPLVLIEAGYYKKPFISFTTADKHRPGGVFCNSKSEFEDTLNYYLSLPNTSLEEIGEQGKEYFQKHHSIKSYSANIENFISQFDHLRSNIFLL